MTGGTAWRADRGRPGFCIYCPLRGVRGCARRIAPATQRGVVPPANSGNFGIAIPDRLRDRAAQLCGPGLGTGKGQRGGLPARSKARETGTMPSASNRRLQRRELVTGSLNLRSVIINGSTSA